MKIGIFFQELLSVLLTPLILFFSLPPCAGAIIDFFRDFTVHVEGMGYVCSFAVFDFRRHGNNPNPEITPAGIAKGNSTPHDKTPSTSNPRSVAERDKREWNRANENKMEKSFLHFKATHPDWIPDPSSSVFLDKLVGMHQRLHPASGGMGGGSGYTPGAGGGRGLGLGGSIYAGEKNWGMDEGRIQERSRSYDRAWAKSSHLLASSPLANGMRGRGSSKDRREGLGLETMDENEEREAEAGLGVGGSEGGRNGRSRDSEEDWGGGGVGGEGMPEDGDERGFLKDVGIVGLLQQIMAR